MRQRTDLMTHAYYVYIYFLYVYLTGPLMARNGLDTGTVFTGAEQAHFLHIKQP